MVKNVMKKCKLTITTVVDGQQSSIVRDGEVDASVQKVQLLYREENAVVCIQLHGDRAIVQRQGDYSLQLHLVPEQKTVGEIGIGGSAGEIETFTHAVQYSVSEHSLLLSLKYDLLISGETQKMQLRLLGKFNK
jgi:uncharacterized beta-barrel protein YwiB (DUF1934 family)